MSDGVPDTPVGRRVGQLLDGLISESFDPADVFDPSFLERVPAAWICSSLRQLRSSLGSFTFVVEPAETNDIEVVGVLAGRVSRRLVCAVNGAAPHLITRMRFSPMPRDPFDLAGLGDVPRLLEHHGCVGLTAALLLDGEIAWARGWRMADADAGREMTAQTLVQVGSISKPVTAAAVTRLVEGAVLDLDVDVNRYLTSWELPPTGRWQPAVTLRQILTHTAGLSVWGFPGYAPTENVPTPCDVLDGEGNTPAIRAEALPGAMWRYSGGGYILLQQLLQDVCGEPFPALMHRLVLRPFGMDHSTFEQPLPAHLQTRSSAAHVDGEVALDRIHVYPEMAAAGLWTTPTDLLRFATHMPPQMRNPSPAESSMGLGIFLAGDPSALTLWHSGGNYGVAADLAWTSDARIGLAVMANDGEWRVLQDLKRYIAARFSWPDLLSQSSIGNVAAQGMQAMRPIDYADRVAVANPTAIAGRYRFRPDWSIQITPQMQLIAPGQPPLDMYAQSEERWVSRDLNVSVEFERESITLQQLGREMRGTRVVEPSDRGRPPQS